MLPSLLAPPRRTSDDVRVQAIPDAQRQLPVISLHIDLIHALAINAERSSYVSGQLAKLAERTRVSLLQNLVQEASSDITVASFVKRGCTEHCSPHTA